MLRALARRMLGELDRAIQDYTAVIEADPQNAAAWMFRGACRHQLASSSEGADVDTLLQQAHADYKRAAELQPDEEQAGLALLEFEVCTDRHLEAIGTSGELWNHVQDPRFKLVCAWLAALALILAGRPESRWARYRDVLTNDQTRLTRTSWCVVEVDSYLKRLEGKGLDPARLAAAKEIHRLFLKHFTDDSAA